MTEQKLTAGDTIDDSEEVYIRRQFKLLLYRLQRLPISVRARLQGHLTQVLIDQTVTVDTPRGRLSFVALGRGGGGRAMTMLTKQPATIEWIDRFRPNSVFWDVGANVGIYTLYAALRGDTSVVAFEPAAVNYFLLAANCEVNKLDGCVQCLLAGLGSERTVARLEVSQFASAQSFSFRGKKKRAYEGRQSAFVFSMDQLVEEFGLPCPNYIKVDVPGLTCPIIEGGMRTLRRPEVREIHLEASEDSTGGRRIIEMLRASGLVLAGKSMHGSTDLTFVRADAQTCAI
jgi:FkbM family methyltransferase